MKLFLLMATLSVFVEKASPQDALQNAHAGFMHPDSVLEWLKTGNNEFVHNEFNVHGLDSSLRIALSKEQHPKAVILTCSDSRVPPEFIFDKRLGDLFVIRVAGNIADDAVIASIEYAVEHLHTNLVVVMGHKNCRAVGAAIADLQNPENKIEDHLRALTDKIEEAIISVNLKESDFNQKALLSNVIFTVSSLSKSRPVLSAAVKKGELKIAGAVYDLTTGKVEWL
ncbi:MAG TPA: carbonic anhydrase [Parafilimonas sp.]|nr:carbonic anhydrase [Parafilimonas sp.]